MTSLPATTLAILLAATPAPGETFNERWPQPEAVPSVAVKAATSEAPRHRHHAERRYHCHRQTFYRGTHRYWRCRR